MSTKFIKSQAKFEEILESSMPQVAMVGRSNVGKSSLINHLANQKGLAHTSSEPGRTQTINYFNVDGRFLLVDLPGIGYAKASKTKREELINLIREYLSLAKINLVLLIIDSRIGLTELDNDMLNYLNSWQIPIIMVVNKIDKLSSSERIKLTQSLEKDYPNVTRIPHSTVTGQGQGEIWSAINMAIKK